MHLLITDHLRKSFVFAGTSYECRFHPAGRCGLIAVRDHDSNFNRDNARVAGALSVRYHTEDLCKKRLTQAICSIARGDSS